MNDAGEVLLTIYERIRAMGPAGQRAVDSSFGLRVSECAALVGWWRELTPSAGHSCHR